MSEVVELRRDCPVVLVPSGRRAVLAEGEHVAIVQRLGGNFTVEIGHGSLARIEGADADALGIEEQVGAGTGGQGWESGAGDGGAGEPGAGEPGVGEYGAAGRMVQSHPDSASAGWRAPDVDEVLDRLRSVYDPEIPVNVVDLGLIYGCEVHPTFSGTYRVAVWMSMTAPGCGMGDILRAEGAERIRQIPGVSEAEVELVFEPPWDLGRMSEAARLQLGMW